MKKLLYPLPVLMLFVLPFMALAASVTIDSFPSTICRLSNFTGTASFGAQDTLNISLDSSTLGTITGGTSWSVAVPTSMTTGSHTLTATVSSTTAGVLATANTSFRVDCGSLDPDSVLQPWGATGHDTPKMSAGQAAIDEFQFHFACPIWAGLMGCFNVSGFDWYRLDVIKYLLKK